MRPRTLDEVAGHAELLSPKGFLRRAIAEDRVPSLIFWGPPGCGKTTLARLIAETTKSRFVPFSAVTSGIKEIKEVMGDAVKLRTATGRRTILFVDEIHRFNRAQQDAFLPYVERGDIVLVGATTENPSFELNAALLSRCKVVMLQALGPEDLAALLRRALALPERGLGESGLAIGDEALGAIVQLANGDGRRALGLLELAVSEAAAAGLAEVTVEGVARLAQRKVLLYDKAGEEHFNLISALHKSLRESDPDAALYWLGRMLAAGEDPNYLARRLVRFASEDIGLADPQALPLTVAAHHACDFIGLPEAELTLAHATLYIATAPKSNSATLALGEAHRVLKEAPVQPVPLPLRDKSGAASKQNQHGKGYRYSHDYPENISGQDYLEKPLALYTPKTAGWEAKIAERLARWRELKANLKPGRG